MYFITEFANYDERLFTVRNGWLILYKIVGSYFRQYLIIWRKKPRLTRGLLLGYRASRAQSHGGSYQ